MRRLPSRPSRPGDPNGPHVLPYAPGVRPARGPLLASVVAGAVAIAGLPTVLAYPSSLVGYLLTLAAGLSVAAVGFALQVRWLGGAGLAVTVAAGAAAAAGVGAVLVVLLVLGPLAVLVVVTDALKRIEPSAPTPFIAGSAIALAAGFAGAVASPPLVVGITVLVLAGACATTYARVTGG